MKNKTDYLKELEKFSKLCLSAVGDLIGNQNNVFQTDIENDNTNHLQKLTDKLRSEYFTPIEREDIYALATNLNDLYLSLLSLNTCVKRNFFFSTNLTMISDFLYSSVQEIDNTIKILLKFPKNDIYNSAFTIKKLTNNASDYIQNEIQNYNNELILSVKECLFNCSSFSDLIIYIYLKNT